MDQWDNEKLSVIGRLIVLPIPFLKSAVGNKQSATPLFCLLLTDREPSIT